MNLPPDEDTVRLYAANGNACWHCTTDDWTNHGTRSLGAATVLTLSCSWCGFVREHVVAT